MDYFLRYTNIKQKKHNIKKDSCALDFSGLVYILEIIFEIRSRNIFSISK